jgi:hypothetical protein
MSGTSDEHATSGWHDCAMNEKQPSRGGQEPPAAAGAQPAPSWPPPPNRRLQAFTGGMLAGIALGGGLAVVLYVIKKLSPNSAAACGTGCGYGIGGSVTLVLFLGVIIGLGLGIGFAAAVPERTAARLAYLRQTHPGRF